MAKKKICVSFDYEYDRRYYNLLEAWDSNNSFEFSFNDMTPNEIQTSDVYAIKRALSRVIGEANYMIAIIGEHSNDRHPDSVFIGYKNWQAYEIDKNREQGNGLLLVKINPNVVVPMDAKGIGAKVITGFNEAKIVGALKILTR